MAEKKVKAMKKPMPVYYRVLIAVTALLLVCIAVGTAILNSYLNIYDKTDPLTEAETVFKTYYSTGNYLALIERSLGSEADGERLNTELSAMLDGKKMVLRRANASDEKAIYSVVVDGALLSQFTLIPKPEAQSYERHLWELSEMTLNLDENGSPVFVEIPDSADAETGKSDAQAMVSIKIRIPAFLSLSVDGKTIEKSEVIRSEPSKMLNHLPGGVTNEQLMYSVYQCEAASDAPEIVLTDDAGKIYMPLYNKTNAQYECNDFSWLANDADASTLTGRAIEAETAIERYYAYDDINNDALRLVQKNTALSHELIELTAAEFAHDEAVFSDAFASDFIRHDAKTVSCRVTMTHTMTNTAIGTQQVDQNDYTLILCDDGTGNYLVYSRYSNK